MNNSKIFINDVPLQANYSAKGMKKCLMTVAVGQNGPRVQGPVHEDER